MSNTFALRQWNLTTIFHTLDADLVEVVYYIDGKRSGYERLTKREARVEWSNLVFAGFRRVEVARPAKVS